MSVLLETSAGEIVIDLKTDECPITCENFIKLCKIKYYNDNLFFNIQSNYIAQTGDPTGTGTGGNSIFGIINNSTIGFKNEINTNKKIFNKIGLVCMASKDNINKSQFFITLRDDDLDHLYGQYTVFGEVAEGMEVLAKLNALFCDEGRHSHSYYILVHNVSPHKHVHLTN